MTAILEPSASATSTRFLWLDLTRACNLACTHCYNGSGPGGDHGTMTREDWVRVLDQAASAGVTTVQFIGGEPTMRPHAAELVEHALALGLSVQIYTNLVVVTPQWWGLFQRPGVSVATSYYSSVQDEHDTVTGRHSHTRTRTNIELAVRRGVPLSVGVIADDTGTYEQARTELEQLGVTAIRRDRTRAFGRAAGGTEPRVSELCGRCRDNGRAAVGPDGAVAPCVMSTFMGVGNVHDDNLAAILAGAAMARVRSTIRDVVGPDDDDGGDDTDTECTPGFPGSGCSPRN